MTRTLLLVAALLLTACWKSTGGTERAFAADQYQRPYSCRLLDDEQRKCAFDSRCDKRVIDRLTRECWRDGGRP